MKLMTARASVDTIIQDTCRALFEHFPGYRVAYSTVDEAGSMSVLYSVGPAPMPDLGGLNIDLTRAPAYLEALRGPAAILLSDTSEDPRVAAVAKELTAAKACACLDVPVIHSSKLVGVICFDAAEPTSWSPEAVATLEDVAEQVTLALKEAHLHALNQAALEDLRDSETRFRQIAENMREVVWLTDPERKNCYYIGAGYDKLWGRDREEALRSGREWVEAIHPADRERVLTSTELTKGTQEQEQVFRVQHRDGTLRWVRDRSFPIFDDKGDPYRLLSLSEDITAQREHDEHLHVMRRQVAQLQKIEALGTLAGGIAHDFNNLLSPILGFAGLTRMQAEDNEAIVENMGEIISAAERARSLVQQILTFSRESQRQLCVVDVCEMVEETTRLLRATLPSTIELQSDLTPNTRILADPTQVHQVLMNLATNAAKAMEGKGGRLAIAVRPVQLDAQFALKHPEIDPGPHLLLEVKDTGCGIPPELLERVFEPFFTSRPSGEGTGMGLAVVVGVVHDCGGCIELSSTLGQGTTFSVYFPIDDSANYEFRGAGPGSPIPVGTEHILFVDDEAFQVRLAEKLLGRLGYRVSAFNSGHAAYEAFRSNPARYDILVSDLTMPGMTGDTLVESLRTLRPDLPAVLCTGHLDRLSRERRTAMQRTRLAEKPLDIEQIGRMLREVLDEQDAPDQSDKHAV